MSDRPDKHFLKLFVERLNLLAGGDWRLRDDGACWCATVVHPDGRSMLLAEDGPSNARRYTISSGPGPRKTHKGHNLEGHDYSKGGTGNPTFACTASASRLTDAIIKDVVRKVLEPWEPVWEKQLENLQEQVAYVDDITAKKDSVEEILGVNAKNRWHDTTSTIITHYPSDGGPVFIYEVRIGSGMDLKLDIRDFDFGLDVLKHILAKAEERAENAAAKEG